MNIHENMLRQIIMKTIRGVKRVGSGIKSGAETVMGAMAKAPPETLHGPYGMKSGVIDEPITPLEAGRFGSPRTKITDPRADIQNPYTLSGIRQGGSQGGSQGGPLKRFR